MVCAVTEGEDKPLKYPLMFRACELVIVNKIDLLPHLDFDLDKLLYNIDVVHPGVERIVLSARTGEGVDAWRDWLLRIAARARGGACLTPCRRAAALSERTECNARFFDGVGRAAGAALPPDGRAVRARGPADRVRPLARGAVGRTPRRGRVRASGDRRQARAAGDRRSPARAAAGAAGRAARAARRHRDRLRRGLRRGAALAVARGRGLPDDRVRAGREPSGSSSRRRPTRISARSWSRRSTTCCGSSCTCSSSTAGCSRAAPSAASTMPARRASCIRSSPSARDDLDAGARGRAPLGADEGRGDRRAARADADRERAVLVAAAGALRASFERGGTLLALGNGGSATDAMDVVADFRGRRPPRDRPHRGPGDPHRDRQRHRRRGDLLAPGDRLRRRAATRCWRSRPRATRAT